MISSFQKLIILSFIIIAAGCSKDSDPGNGPAITSISPTTGHGGTVITIAGSRFYEDITANVVTVNGKPARVLTATTTQLTVKVPLLSRTGTVNVKTKDGTRTGPTFNYFDVIMVGGGDAGASVWNLDSANVLNPNGHATNFFLQDTTLYASGYIYDNNNTNFPHYWKNGVATALGTAAAFTASIGAIGSDVYVGGTLGIGVGTAVAVYWKNGAPQTLGDASFLSEVLSGTVSGSDFYFCGYQYVGDLSCKAMVWKNGAAIPLTDGTGIAHASDIEISKSNDVYVSGFSFLGKPNYFPLYWKNGTLVDLTSSTQYGYAEGIHVDGSDVYVSGEIMVSTGLQAVYWKNGTMVTLPVTSRVSQAFDITVDGTDVYVCGADNDKAVYWKNGVEVTLANSDYGQANHVLVVK